MKYRRIFYVCFRKSRRWRWWHIFTGSDLQHVFLITSCKYNNCVMIDSAVGGTGIWTFSRPAKQVAKQWLHVRYLVTDRGMDEPLIIFGRTCVDIVKDFLGIKKWWIITPEQLYREVQNG